MRSLWVSAPTFSIRSATWPVSQLRADQAKYGDYRDQLVSWEEYHRDVAAYAVQAGVSADPAAFVADLKAKFAAVANEVDRAFPDNEHVEIVGGRPVIGRLRAKATPDGADRLERLMKERLAPIGILDALAETEHWLGWTRAFGPVSGFEAKLDRPRERYLSAAFCYGCGLGPTWRRARSRASIAATSPSSISGT